ncbi:MAG: ATP-dependent helicase HrpB [Alphaproteobacteria bacterium]|nr:ATP-dependent helicase HrpB [Alphaproteobacteria bacterium]
MTSLPIDSVLGELGRALETPGVAVLQAPPGAGKTTGAPLFLLKAPWLGGQRIVMLEPRRLAARMAARRMGQMLGEAVGETVGYRVRMESRVGPSTRIEVVTDGLFTRMVQGDPGLEGIGAVIFDEFHERRLESDLGLALCLEARALLRPDLRLLVMSATLDGAAVAALLGDGPMVTSEGRRFAVDVVHLARPPPTALAGQVAATIERALAETGGDVLAFLPSVAEIGRTQRRLGALGEAIDVVPLHGDLPLAMQDRAIAPAAAGRRKVVLATAIAETSLTIEGVRAVVDAGLMRQPRFDARTGMDRLETFPVTQASAEQRRGRAGRVAPGRCYRLWSEAEHRALLRFGRPEILDTDLTALALELSLWGAGDSLRWLDPPPAPALARARDLLRRLGAMSPEGKVTPHGRAMAALGVHPRLAHMLLRARAMGRGGLACDLAALLGERDLLRAGVAERTSDLGLRLDLLQGRTERGNVDAGMLRRVREVARRLARRLDVASGAGGAGDGGMLGWLVAEAYPDRIAQRRGGAPGQFRLAVGRGASLAAHDSLAGAEWLAIADLDDSGRDARIYLAAPLTLEAIEAGFPERIETVDEIAWDEGQAAVLARRQRRLDALILGDDPLPAPEPAEVLAALIAGIRAAGLGHLPWTAALRNVRARVALLRGIEGESWPDLSDVALLAGLEAWLAPWLRGITRRSQFGRIDLGAALAALLGHANSQRLDQLMPSHVKVPSGSSIAIDYAAADGPILAVRLQEMFGAVATPKVAGGRVALVLHLLSPAGRPVQVTCDLASFWANAYRQVRADLRGRYPRHHWPEDPLQAAPTRRVKARGRS